MDAIEFACVVEAITKPYSINMPIELAAKIYNIYIKKAPIYTYTVDDYDIYYTEYEEYEEYIYTYDDIQNSYNDDDEDIDDYEIDNDEIAYRISQKLCKSY
jgi:hypothetical protein